MLKIRAVNIIPFCFCQENVNFKHVIERVGFLRFIPHKKISRDRNILQDNVNLFYRIWEDIYMCSADFKQHEWNLSRVPRPLTSPSNIFATPMVTSGTRIDFYACTRWRKCPRVFFSHVPSNFLGGIHWPFLQRSTWGPCIYASLVLKCSHKPDPLTAKSWRNLSVRMSLVYIIVVLTKRTMIKKGNCASFLTACVLYVSVYEIVDKSFSCYPTRVLKLVNLPLLF